MLCNLSFLYTTSLFMIVKKDNKIFYKKLKLFKLKYICNLFKTDMHFIFSVQRFIVYNKKQKRKQK